MKYIRKTNNKTIWVMHKIHWLIKGANHIEHPDNDRI